MRYSIGYGYTAPSIGPDTVWTQGQAVNALYAVLSKSAKRVERVVKVPLEPRQKAALTDFVYNIGIGAFRQSTMLVYLNQGLYQQAANEFPRWVYDDGEELPGLVTRRRRERSLFLTGEWD